MSERLSEVLTRLFLRPGYPFEREDFEETRATIEAVLRSGRWVMLADPQNRLLWGFMGWIRTTEEGAELIRERSFKGLMREGVSIPAEGDHVVLLFNIIAPWAPDVTLLALWKLVKEKNPDALFIESFVTLRGGYERWIKRRI
jgi:hypothetical protein